MNSSGQIKLFQVRGVPVLMHWTVLLAWPLSWLLTKSFVNGTAGLFGFIALMLTHELGHAVVAWRCRLRVFAINLYPMHGECHYQAPYSHRVEVLVAWGGVVAQALLFGLAALTAKLLGAIGGIPDVLASMLFVWVPINLLTMFLNLLPMPPLDGAKTWQFLRYALAKTPSTEQPEPSTVKPKKSADIVSLDSHRISKDKPRDT